MFDLILSWSMLQGCLSANYLGWVWPFPKRGNKKDFIQLASPFFTHSFYSVKVLRAFLLLEPANFPSIRFKGVVTHPEQSTESMRPGPGLGVVSPSGCPMPVGAISLALCFGLPWHVSPHRHLIKDTSEDLWTNSGTIMHTLYSPSLMDHQGYVCMYVGDIFYTLPPHFGHPWSTCKILA